MGGGGYEAGFALKGRNSQGGKAVSSLGIEIRKGNGASLSRRTTMLSRVESVIL